MKAKNMPNFERPAELQGVTLKIRPPVTEHAIYITITHIGDKDSKRPVEIFINSKDMSNFQYITCITRLLSSVLRQSGDFPWYALEELVNTFDPSGGYVIPHTRGKRANGIVSHIGIVLINYCESLGLERPKKKAEDDVNEN